MTAKRDLKRRVRERQARTGESYMTARHHVTGQREPSPFDVVELVDLSADAARLGLRGEVRASSELMARVEREVILTRLRDALVATAGDPATEPLRSVLITGERAVLRRTASYDLDEGRRFIARARAGIGGPSESGRLLALYVEGRRGLEVAVCVLWMVLPAGLPFPRDPSVMPHLVQPAVILGTADDLQIGSGLAAGWVL